MSLSSSLLEYGRHCVRAIPLAMITMRKSTHGFPSLSHDKYGAPLGGPSGRRSSAMKKFKVCTIKTETA